MTQKILFQLAVLILAYKGIQRWYKEGKLHRNGTRAWYKEGKLHRDNNLPAIICADGTQFFIKTENLHRETGVELSPTIRK